MILLVRNISIHLVSLIALRKNITATSFGEQHKLIEIHIKGTAEKNRLEGFRFFQKKMQLRRKKFILR